MPTARRCAPEEPRHTSPARTQVTRFSSTVCCILSPLSHAASSTTFEFAYELNTFACAHAPTTRQPAA
eukprot:4802295-Pleurochrysis_carterae.AAC.1